MINKDTLIFGSFAKQAGNNGCIMFNTAFAYYGMNAVYKSFSVDIISEAIYSARILNFAGFAITMPFKKDAIKFVDELSDAVREIGATNTIINRNGKLKAYNTDYLAAKSILDKPFNKPLFILGNGGYAAAVKYAAQELKMKFKIITRENWSDITKIKNSIVYNCTPVSNIEVDDSNEFIDCLITTDTGMNLSKIQAAHQFKLYTGLEFPEVDLKH